MCPACKTSVMPHLLYNHHHLLHIMQLLDMLFLEWSVTFDTVRILTVYLFIYFIIIFCPTLDSDNAIVHVEEETLTEAYMDSLVTVDACFKYL